MPNNDRPHASSTATQRQKLDVQLRPVEQREAHVLGDGPRLKPLQPEELSDELLALVERVIQINLAVNAREPEVLTDLVAEHASGAEAARIAALLAGLPEIVRTMLRHPDLFARQTEIGIQLLKQNALSARDRELAVLRIGWLCQAPYEWGEHVLIAKSLGISSDEIERVTQGSEAAGWSELEQAVLRAVDELYHDAMISDATWTTLSKWLSDKQLIELPVLVGQYQTVAYYQNSLRLRLHSGNRGLQSR
jgi:alkylhydroperoxidase family enzyme